MKGKKWKILFISDIMYEYPDEDFSRIETCSKEGYTNWVVFDRSACSVVLITYCLT